MTKGVIKLRRLTEIRKKREITQKELAKRIGKSRTTVTEYEQGNIEPKSTTIIKICNELQCSADWLLEIEK